MSRSLADLSWPTCGRTHQVATKLPIERGPATSGTVAELYEDSKLPPALVELQQAMVWCERAGVCVAVEERGRGRVRARRG